ncbi:MAG: CsgG/HfaB family protein [Treponema sp.]|nr:CsgG/HfaB family protein [Treponema sp.]
MNNFNFFVALILYFSLASLCWAQSQPLHWTGDGGRGIRVTVSEPKGTGLSAQEQSLLPLIQSTIIGSFQRFSAMTVFDRQNLENVLREQRLSMSGNFSDTDYIRIGRLTNARLVVFGSITKISNNYTLELAVTDVETGERKASYMPRQVSLMALENLSAIREASADLLGQLGINLTNNGLQELRRSEDTAKIQYENNLARGIAAERQGTVVEALTYYFQAAAFNPSLMEAANRVSVVSANISGGNLGQTVRNRLQIHDDWRTIVNTARSFYSNHLPYELVYGTNINRGRIDFERRTTELSIEIGLIPTDAWKTINDLRQGLRSARGNDQWNFSLDQIDPSQIIVIIQIMNENNTVLSRESYAFKNPNEKVQTNATLNFRNIKADDITDQLRVEVVSINGSPAQRAGESGFIQITTLREYNRRMAPIRAAEEAARKEQEAAARRQERFKHTSLIPPVYFELGYIFQPGYPLGFRIGTFGFYTTWNFGIKPDFQDYFNFTYVTASPSYVDLGNRVNESYDGVFGFSFNVFDNLLMIPIGIGFRYIKEYGLFNDKHVSSFSGEVLWDETKWYPMSEDGEYYLIFEIGLSYNPIKWVSLVGTLRGIASQGASINIGICLTVPSR